MRGIEDESQVFIWQTELIVAPLTNETKKNNFAKVGSDAMVSLV